MRLVARGFAALLATALLASVVLRPATLPVARRGVHLTPDPTADTDYRALAVLQPRWMVVLSAQLGDPDPIDQVDEDPRLEAWLRANPDVQPIVRMWPVKQPEPVGQLAARIAAIHQRYPWIRYFIPANEPDIEWGNGTSWAEIGAWTRDLWYAVDQQRTADGSGIRLLFPPFAQDSTLNPEAVGYDAVRASVELYLDHGDGLAAHEYWDRDDVFLVEDRWPAWLQQRLGSVPFFVTEAGWRPIAANGQADAELGRELVSFAERSRANVVSPFLLSSAKGTFAQQALVDAAGVPRPTLYAWASGATW